MSCVLYAAAMKAAILTIGEELVQGQTVDTNSAWLSTQWMARGWEVVAHHTVGDDLQAMVGALQMLADQADRVVVSGGLGPTADDLTRQALAEVLGESLVVDDEAAVALEAWLVARGKPGLDAQNRLQVMRPESAAMLANPAGTAPGLQAQLPGGTQVFCLPGVPREVREMWQQHADVMAPVVAGRALAVGSLHLFGLSESEVGRRLKAHIGQRPDEG